MSTEQTWTQETQTAAKRRVLNRLGLSLKEQEDALAEIERARGEIERLTQQVEILATRSAAAEARLLTVRATPAPLTEAEARAWGDAVSVTMLYDDRPGNGARIAAAILAASRGDFPAEVRPRPPKREPMSGDFDFASCQHPEHARNEADDGTTWCILCGDVLSAGRCGKIAPDGYPGAGNPCTLPAGHGSGHEARSADGRLLAVSLPPAPGDIPASIRPEADPAVQAAIRGLERVAPQPLGDDVRARDLSERPAEMAVTTEEPAPTLTEALANVDAAERAALTLAGWTPAVGGRPGFWTEPGTGTHWPRATALGILRDRTAAPAPKSVPPPFHAVWPMYDDGPEVSK